MSGLAIGIASSGRKVELLWSLTLPILTANGPVGMNVGWLVAKNEKGKENDPLERARNREKIVEKAISAGFEYLFFLDDDTCCPNFTLKYLHYQLANDPLAMVCGGIYCTKEEIPCPLVFKELGSGPFYEWKVGDVFSCKGLGTGSMMMKTKVFEHLSKPWFFEPNETPVDKTITLGDVENVPLLHEGGTDDLFFCKKVTDAGFKILAHGGVLPVHLGDDGKMFTLPLNSYPCQ